MLASVLAWLRSIRTATFWTITLAALTGVSLLWWFAPTLWNQLKAWFDLHSAVISWAAVLVNLIIMSVLGHLAPTMVSQANRPRRSHNPEKIWNDCLARHQLAYVSFYFTLMVRQGQHPREVQLQFLALLIIISFTFWLVGIKYVVDQDRNIRHLHGATCNHTCNSPIDWATRLRIVRTNALMALLSLSMVVVVLCGSTIAYTRTSEMTGSASGLTTASLASAEARQPRGGAARPAIPPRSEATGEPPARKSPAN